MPGVLTCQKSDAAVPLALTINQEGVGGIIGQAPTVAIRRGDSTTLYLDWNDGAFKAVGWGSKYAAMTEIERGHYLKVVDISAAPGILPGQILAVEYHVDDGGVVKGDAHDLLIVVATLYAPATFAQAAALPGLTAIIAGVLDELLAGHATPGTAGKALIDAAAGSSAGVSLTVEGA